MSSEREQLVEAAIGQLRAMQQRGTRYVMLSAESVSVLTAAESPTASVAATRPSNTGFPASMKAAIETGSETKATPRPLTVPGAPPKSSPAAPPAMAVPSTAPTGPSTLLSSAEKTEAMRELRERALVCMKCPNLAAARTNVVFGVGSLDADLMFVGEAPGADEDREGEPFVGAAGQLLTKIIQTMGLSRSTVYIGNILKCRPDTPGQASGNRKPTADEMNTCIPYLHSQIDIIRPKVLVALGGTAVEGLLGSIGGITRVRGHWQEYRGIPLMPTFHPAYLLRNMALSEKRKVWEDMLQVMERLAMPISEKQRSFFLPKSS